MGGTSKQQSNTTQESQLTPWAPAGDQIQGILSGLSPSIANMSGTPEFNQALSGIEANAQNPNPLGALAMNAGSSLLGGGGNYNAATGLLNSTLGKTNAALAPYTSWSALDPTTNPALASQLNTAATDATNRVNSTFAAAGRFGSPGYAQALGRGIVQGEAPILQNAVSNQLSAIGMGQSAGGGTAAGLSGLDTANAGILGAGLGGAGTAYNTQNLGNQDLLTAALTRMGQPIQSAQALTGILGPLAAQFGHNQGSSNSVGYNTMSPAQTFAMWGQGFNSFMNPFKTNPTPAALPTG